jgi:hypothetical protein
VTVTRRSKSQIRRQANIFAAEAVRSFVSDGYAWQDDWSDDDNDRLLERLAEIADVLETR